MHRQLDVLHGGLRRGPRRARQKRNLAPSRQPIDHAARSPLVRTTAAAQLEPLPVIENIHTNTAAAKERARALAEELQHNYIRCADVDVRKYEVRQGEEWMPCS